MSPKLQILQYESRLLEAMKTGDLKELDELLHDDLLFIIPTGQTVTKAMDMENIRLGKLSIETISSKEHAVSIIDDNAIVTMNVEIKGKYLEEPIEAAFKYIRVWKLIAGHWKVIGGAGMQV